MAFNTQQVKREQPVMPVKVLNRRSSVAILHLCGWLIYALHLEPKTLHLLLM